jgi:hypothetical protein
MIGSIYTKYEPNFNEISVRMIIYAKNERQEMVPVPKARYRYLQ